MATEATIHSDLAVPPGEYLEEVIAELDMSKDELARRMRRPAAKLSAVFKGHKAITPDTALQLEKVVAVPAHIWLGLESDYRLTLARRQSQTEVGRLRAESKLTAAYCYNQLAKLGAVARTTKPLVKVAELQRFFGVASLTAIPEVRRYQAAFRMGATSRHRRSPEAVASWLRLGEVEARKLDCAAFDKKRLESSLPTLRAMTMQLPEVLEPALSSLLARAGVALIICPHFPGTRVHGATFWVGRDKAALMMTIRGGWADVFWFSLFHELGHILLHGRREVILENDDADPALKEREAEADQFAGESLIPPDDYLRFVASGGFSGAEIEAFAFKSNIDPGVVVGHLQHDGHLKREGQNELRTRYTWAANTEETPPAHESP
ncbi:MAG: HigA family addiction module antitoxin [Actinobacteria bacterium]|nr:HigA family addiction module antitoxin [Actinomycetota bacterium]